MDGAVLTGSGAAVLLAEVLLHMQPEFRRSGSNVWNCSIRRDDSFRWIALFMHDLDLYLHRNVFFLALKLYYS